MGDFVRDAEQAIGSQGAGNIEQDAMKGMSGGGQGGGNNAVDNEVNQGILICPIRFLPFPSTT